MVCEYEFLDYMRDTVQGMVVGKGIDFEDAVFYTLATMDDGEVHALSSEAGIYARSLERCPVKGEALDREMQQWWSVYMMCKRTLNTRHANNVRAKYDQMLDDGQHMKGIQL
jgi:hypothetical protein